MHNTGHNLILTDVYMLRLQRSTLLRPAGKVRFFMIKPVTVHVAMSVAYSFTNCIYV